ncbi:TetR/AcrR family transcriptional regulator [Tsukamurella sp. 8F]|uniref:TetR/AcrR family transcriptional regulator n=1 Tax=unclassified Tsukamurella TaxID=2633480 RepID=UPI0023B943FF|nr:MULTISPECIES: TetR/AcrR family transcriptional regulator [unclassified Tsukamurella]MDF0531272.1 TetR/AcrR family transcriptional regulator [Tsukamurella sp. 8J]MDF0585221.1 TetR/AcrR family transcriptional regulator [Tsukamurella sp. 8F]
MATRLFAIRGFERTSVQELVVAAGVTKGGFYHYFSSKDELLQTIYGRLLAEQSARLDEVASGPGDVTSRLRLAATDVVVTTLRDIDAVTVVARSLYLLEPEVQRAVRADRRRYHERFCEIVLEGQAAGEFRADTTPDLVADFFFGAVHYLPVWYRSGGALSPQEVGGHFADLLLSALLPSA